MENLSQLEQEILKSFNDLISKLEFYRTQKGPIGGRENALALTNAEQSEMWFVKATVK